MVYTPSYSRSHPRPPRRMVIADVVAGSAPDNPTLVAAKNSYRKETTRSRPVYAKHTPAPRLVLDKMQDITCTLNDLMEENVFLRTKIISAKRFLWTKVFGFDKEQVFIQWALVVKRAKSRAEKEIEQYYSAELVRTVDEANVVITQLQDDISKSEEARMILEENVAGLQYQIATMFKSFESVRDLVDTVHTTSVNLADPILRSQMLSEHMQRVKDIEDRPTDQSRQYMVEALHEILDKVDGRYVKPLPNELASPKALGIVTNADGTTTRQTPTAAARGLGAPLFNIQSVKVSPPQRHPHASPTNSQR